MNRKELITSLRENAEWCDCEEWNIPICMGDNQREAADMLENDQKHMDALMAENDRLKKQLDAAVDEIAHIAKDGKTWMCPYCKNCNGTSYGFADCKKGGLCSKPYTLFEWRGMEDAE